MPQAGRQPRILRRRVAARWAPMVAMLAASTCRVAAADDAAIATFSSAAAGQPPAAWKFAGLPNKTPTKFSIVDLDGAKVLKVEAESSYGNLVHAMKAQIGERSTLSWRWRVDKLIDEADLRTRGGDDSPAKVCVFFDFDASKLSLGERTKLSIARNTAGQDVPAQALCYVWDNKLAEGSGAANAFTKRIRFIVLESGTGKLGQWVAQRRTIAADYQRLFGDESEGKLPTVVGIAVAADADNTQGHSVAYFGDVGLTP